MVEEPEAYVESVRQMLRAWAEGDREALAGEDDTESTEDMSAEEAEELQEVMAMYEDLDVQLLDVRNQGFLEDAISFLKEGTRALIAIGAAHISDHGGLVDLLTAAGYTVEQISPETVAEAA